MGTRAGRNMATAAGLAGPGDEDDSNFGLRGGGTITLLPWAATQPGLVVAPAAGSACLGTTAESIPSRRPVTRPGGQGRLEEGFARRGCGNGVGTLSALFSVQPLVSWQIDAMYDGGPRGRQTPTAPRRGHTAGVMSLWQKAGPAFVSRRASRRLLASGFWYISKPSGRRFCHPPASDP